MKLPDFLSTSPRQDIYVSELWLPTNQFRLGENFEFWISYLSFQDLSVEQGYIALQSREFYKIVDDYPTGPANVEWKRNVLFQQGHSTGFGKIGPSIPYIIAGEFTIPLDCGWTIPKLLEWSILTGITVNGRLTSHVFGITVLPIIMLSETPKDNVEPEGPMKEQG